MDSEASQPLARRLRGLPWRVLPWAAVPVAVGYRSRLLGLALLGRRRAGPGLLLPGCRAVHTFGMRFELDVVFLGDGEEVLRVERAVPPGRLLAERRARTVLELPAGATAIEPGLGGGPMHPPERRVRR